MIRLPQDSRTRRRFFWGSLAAALAGWAGFAWLVVPKVIQSAYRGESLSLLNALIRGREVHGLDYYQALWWPMAWQGFFWVVALWAIGPLARRMATGGFYERCVGPATPGTLGAIRALICLILLMSTLWEDLASVVFLPRDFFDFKYIGVLRGLFALPIGMESFLADWTALRFFDRLSGVLLFLAGIGLWTRVTVPAAALSYLVLAGILRGFTFFYHTGLIPLLVLSLLSFTPCGDGFSVDRLLRQRRGKPVPPRGVATPVYGWARYFIWIVIAVPYTAAGMSKIRNGGLMWWHPHNIKSIVLDDTVSPMEFDFGVSLHLATAPDAVFALLGIVALLTELTFALVLVSRTARLYLPALMLSTHVGILLLQNILFFDLIMIQAVFYDWRPVRARLTRWLEQRGWLPARLLPAKRETVAAAAGIRRFAPLPWALACLSLAYLLFFSWLNRVEFFPLTSMKMYSSRKSSGQFVYLKALAIYENGDKERAYFDRWIKAVADGRYVRELYMVFKDEDQRRIIEEFFESCARQANETLEPGRRLVGIEIQEWQWNFLANPDSPTQGRHLTSYVYNVRELAPAVSASALSS